MASNKQIQSLIQQSHSSSNIQYPRYGSFYKVEERHDPIEPTTKAMAELTIEELRESVHRQSSVGLSKPMAELRVCEECQEIKRSYVMKRR